MGKIYKYKLEYDLTNEIELPDGSRVLCAKVQRDKICIWVDYTDSKTMFTLKVRLVLTGEKAPTGYRYVDTCLLRGGDFVVHIYID